MYVIFSYYYRMFSYYYRMYIMFLLWQEISESQNSPMALSKMPNVHCNNTYPQESFWYCFTPCNETYNTIQSPKTLYSFLISLYFFTFIQPRISLSNPPITFPYTYWVSFKYALQNWVSLQSSLPQNSYLDFPCPFCAHSKFLLLFPKDLFIYF